MLVQRNGAYGGSYVGVVGTAEEEARPPCFVGLRYSSLAKAITSIRSSFRYCRHLINRQRVVSKDLN